MKALLMLPLLLADAPARPTARMLSQISVSQEATQVKRLLQSLQQETAPRKELALRLQQSTVMAKKVLADRLVIHDLKPRPVVSIHEKFLRLEGTSFIIPLTAEQRSCTAIRKDWQQLDEVYGLVNELALELEEVYSHPRFCAPCADTVLNTLQEATRELEDISTRLNQDGSRRVQIIWGPEAFSGDQRWEKLIYYNIDGESRAAGPQEALPNPEGLLLRSPLVKHGIQFHREISAERACSPGLEIRFDGRLQSAANPMQLILFSYPGTP
jgi:hypothetical protein